jgi:para-nitrobenzyl esterase
MMPGSGGAPPTGGSTGTGGATSADDAGVTFTATTKSGVVIGKADAKTRAFLGIPYAGPPTGVNRWKPPLPVTPWTTPRDARTPAKVCPQITVGGSTIDTRSDEDCLTLNVWTPEPAAAKALPVMVWIHGGAFLFGSGAETFYDGSTLVSAGNLVVVTINYRIGALGFLSHPALTKESADHATSGNYGFEDQQAALRWVKDNIGAFGGDPGQVTIFGESAGGYSVCSHLVAPGSKGLFQRAISESGYCSGYLGTTREDAYPNGQALALALGCADGAKTLECLRAKTPDDFLHAFDAAGPSLPGGLFFQGDGKEADGGVMGTQRWNPVVDGTVIPVRVADVGPSFNKVPLLLGTNADEGTLFTSPTLFKGVPVANDAEYQTALGRTFGADTAKVVAQYPSASFKTANDALNVVANDSFFACPARRLARNAAAAGADVFLYAFHHAPEMPLIPGLGSYHAAEFSYIFGFDTVLAKTQDDELPLATLMRGYWTRFVNTGDPNGGDAPSWPKYTAAGDQNLGLDIPTSALETGTKKAKCDFWDSIYK